MGNRDYLLSKINGTEGSAFYTINVELDAEGKIIIEDGGEIFGAGDGLMVRAIFADGFIGVFSQRGKIIISQNADDNDRELDRAAVVEEFNRWKQQPEVKCRTTHQFGRIRKDYYLCED